MSSGKAQAYARALFDLAALADSVDATDEGLRSLVEAARSHAGLRDALADASVPAQNKREILRELFGENVTAEALAIVTVIVERGDAALLDDVSRAFDEIAEAERGMVVAQVTTAVPLDDALRSRITEKLTASLDRPVALRERVDESILGGVVIKVAGRVLDGSLALQLDEARTRLSSTPTGGES
jgi:F-type H+-transporting ATPase subunit delta